MGFDPQFKDDVLAGERRVCVC